MSTISPVILSHMPEDGKMLAVRNLIMGVLYKNTIGATALPG